jgi:FkbM family methyltransferase
MPRGLNTGLKQLAARLPLAWQQELKRHYFRKQIRSRSFKTNEPEYERLSALVSSGDWVLDIGANIGHYTMRLSELVGELGRVISFEPVPETFELLAAHACMAPFKNITLINAAASESAGISSMDIPRFNETGLNNYYMARLSNDGQGSGLRVLRLPIDALQLPHPIRLVKVDAEGHEMSVLQGMKRLLASDHPILIVEDNDPGVVSALEELGYESEKILGSSNRIFKPVTTS